MVNGDAHSSCKLSAKFSSFELSESESAAVSDLTSIFASHRRDDRSELLNGSGEHFFGFPFSALMSSELLCWLIEVSFDSALPVLTQMDVWDDVVVLGHC